MKRNIINMSINEAAYRQWLAANSTLSHKGQNDMISRLKRGDKIVPFSPGVSFASYARELQGKVEWTSIPTASQQTILGAAKKYLEWMASTR
jgi:hypothetical protein